MNDSFFCAEKNEEIHKVAHVEGEGFIFTYESEGQGCGKIGIGKGDERLSFSVYALQRNPLRNMVFGLVEIRDYHREEYNTWWYSTSGEIDLKMINKGSDLEIKLTILDQDFGIDKEYDWTLSLDEVIGAVLSAAKKALRTRGIVGLSKDWMEEDVAECDFFPFADFFALAGVDVKVEDGDIAHSSFEEEFRILQQLCE